MSRAIASKTHKLAVALAAFVVAAGSMMMPTLNAPPAAATVAPAIIDSPVGQVNAIDVANGVTYLGGTFTAVGANTGGGAVVDAATGVVNRAFPAVLGKVHAVTPDGSGGYFIGGQFTAVGGVPRKNAARILADGSVDLGWNPNVTGAVHDVVLSGSTVYLGGDIVAVNRDVTRRGAAAVDNASGTLTQWNPDINGAVLTIAVSGSTVFVGGRFSTVNGGLPRNNAAAVSATAGVATPWNPNLSGPVHSLIVSGSTVYLGGGFTVANGSTARLRLAAVTTSTGALTAWNPIANDPVSTMVLSGSKLYVAGDFTTVGGVNRNRAAAVNITTAAVDPWNPDINGGVRSMALSGSTMYLIGPFTTVNGGTARLGAAAVNSTTGIATAWSPGLGEGNFTGPDAYALNAAGGRVYIGGTFLHVNLVTRFCAAAIDATGRLTAWNPNVDSTVNVVKVVGPTVYVGGVFTEVNVSPSNPVVGGTSRYHAAAFDATTGLVKPWNPAFDGIVRDVAVSDSTVYVVGEFTTVNGRPGIPGQARNHAAAVDATTGAATAWNPNFNGNANALVLAGSNVFVGGEFTTVNGSVARNRAAAVDVATGVANGWNPNVGGPVNTLAVAGSTVFAGGQFLTVNGTLPRSNVAAFNATSGTATGWNPGASAVVNDIAANGSTVYVAGLFSSVSGVERLGAAAFHAISGVLSPWNPRAGINGVWVVVASGDAVYLGGNFVAVENHATPPLGSYAARLSADPGIPTEFVPIAPVRALDTRVSPGQPVKPWPALVVDLSKIVPPGATAIAFNATATAQTASGYLDVSPEGYTSGSSLVNWGGPLETIANGHIVKISENRTLQLNTMYEVSAHVILDVTGYFAPPGTANGTLYQAANRRIYDSRATDGVLPPGASRVVNINTGGTPQAVAPTAAAVNVTVTGTTGSGVLTVARNVSTTTSTINWNGAAQTIANAVITDVGPGGEFTVTNNGRTPAHVLIDLTGTFAPSAAGATGAQFYAVNPTRTYDSRADAAGRLNAGQSRTTFSPVPDSAVAVAVNTTITGTEGTGFLSVTPPGVGVPMTSTVNWFTSPTTRANGSIVPTVDTANQAYVGGAYSTQYLYDLAGYFR